MACGLLVAGVLHRRPYRHGRPDLRAVAFGADPRSARLGCDGESVRPLERSETEPITSACLDLIYPLADRCTHADPDVACP